MGRRDLNVVGVDLAWTERGGTGLCHAIDGRVVDSTRLIGSLGPLVEWVGPRIEHGGILGIDAPLIVPDDGRLRRGCDDLVSRVFGANYASTHSAHRGMPAFRDGGRAAALARALDLDTDPLFQAGSGGRRAIEVYPHAAIVGRFDLPFTLKYKAKPGRTLAGRAAELGRLLDLLESLGPEEAGPPRFDVTTASRWPTIRQTVAAPESGAELSRIEDEIDGYVCAYVALAWWRRDGPRCRVFGDHPNGYIVTPVTPAHERLLDTILG